MTFAAVFLQKTIFTIGVMNLKQWKAELALLLVTFLWGGTFLFTKLGLDDCTPSTFILMRFMIALSLSMIFFGRKLKGINRETLIQGIILGLLFGGGFVLQTYGLKFTSVSKTAFITGMTVPITPFVFKLIQKTKIQLWSKIGVVVATIGLYVFTKPDFDNINLGISYPALYIFGLFISLLWINSPKEAVITTKHTSL